MRKIISVLLLTTFLASCGHPEKHTGTVQLLGVVHESRYWFIRPNGEVFEMWFDNPPAFAIKSEFVDVTYTDDSRDQRHFVKAQAR